MTAIEEPRTTPPVHAYPFDPTAQFGPSGVSDWTHHDVKPCWAHDGWFRCVDCGTYFAPGDPDEAAGGGGHREALIWLLTGVDIGLLILLAGVLLRVVR